MSANIEAEDGPNQENLEELEESKVDESDVEVSEFEERKAECDADQLKKLKTEPTIIKKLQWHDQASAEQFLDWYRPLIENFIRYQRQAYGIDEAEHGEILQKVYFELQKIMPRFVYDPKCKASPILRRGSIKDLCSLVKRLKNPGDAVSRYLMGRLNEETRQQVLDYEGSLEGETRDLTICLARALNWIIKGEPIFDKERFATVALSSQTRVLLTTTDDVPRLNRYLLRDAYPEELALPPGKFRNYLRTVVRNVTSSYYRKLKSERERLRTFTGVVEKTWVGISGTCGVEPAPEEENALDPSWMKCFLAELVARKKITQRSMNAGIAILLEDKAAEKVAEEFDMEVNAVYAQRHKLKKLIAAELERVGKKIRLRSGPSTLPLDAPPALSDQTISLKASPPAMSEDIRAKAALLNHEAGGALTKGAWLLWRDASGHVFATPIRTSVSIGRGARCGVRMEMDKALGARHCRVYRQDDDCFLEDMDSKNGTFVNSAECRVETIKLNDGDCILVANHILLFIKS